MNDGEGTFSYDLYGCRVLTDRALPEVAPAPAALGPGEADIVIAAGAVSKESLPDAPDETGLIWGEDWCGVRITGVGRFLVERGRRITIDLEPGVEANEVRAYLLGSILSIALHQRGFVPLHVSAVMTPGGVVAFTGESGAGKSTLAARLNRRYGWPIVCDDVGVIRPQDAAPLLHGGVRRMKLWKDALGGVAAQASELTRDVARFDKFLVDRPDAFHGAAAPMRHLVLLERGEALSLSELAGMQKFEAVLATVYRPAFGNLFNDRRSYFQTCSRLASEVRVWRLERPWTEAGLAASLEFVREKFAD